MTATSKAAAKVEAYAESARALARRLYGCNDTVEIDDNAMVFPADQGGSWVAAWVYLSNETLDAEGIINPQDEEPSA